MAIRVPRGAHRERTTDETVDLDLTAEGPVALEELFQHRDALHSLCQRIVGDAATADDMVQETYLRALRHLDRLERRPSLMPWLATVARRRSLDELRRRKYSTTVEEFPDEPGHVEHEPHESVPALDTLEHVREAFQTLNARERRLLRRQVEEGLSLSELAAADNSSVASVRSVLVRARGKLREALGEKEIWLPAGAPIAGALAWIRRRMTDINMRIQQHAASVPLERMGEAVTVGVVAAALGAGIASPHRAWTDSLPEREVAAPAANDSEAPIGSASPKVATDTATSAGSVGRLPIPTEPGPLGERLPGSGAVDGVLPPDDVEGPEDARFEHFAVAGDSSSPVVLAAGTRRRGCVSGCTVLFESLDGGTSWNRLPAAGLPGTAIAVAPGYPSDPRIFAGGPGGLAVSRNRGVSFSPLPLPANGAVWLSPEFANGDERIFVGSSPPWVWDDATGTAEPVLGIPSTESVTHMAFSPDYGRTGVLFLAGAAPGDGDFHAAVYRCTRTLGEDTCVESSILPGVRQVPQIAVSPGFAEDRTVLAWTDDVLLRSTDAGASFASVPVPGRFAIGAIAGDSTATLFAAARGVDGDAYGGVFRSVDGGATWRIVATGTAVDRGAVTVAVLPNDTVIVAPIGGGGGGLLCSTDHGVSWNSRCA